MPTIIKREWDEVLISIAAEISRAERVGEYEAYDLRCAAKAYKEMRERLAILEGKT